MTVEEILDLVAAYADDRFCQRFNGGPRFMAMQDAIQLVVAERDDAREDLDACRRIGKRLVKP